MRLRSPHDRQSQARHDLLPLHPANNNRGRPDKHADHPPTVYMREDLVLAEISKLYAERVFGRQRRDLLLADLEAVDDTAQRERGEERQRLQRKLADAVRKQENVLSQAENAAPNDPFTQGLRQRYNDLNSERETIRLLPRWISRTRPNRAVQRPIRSPSSMPCHTSPSTYIVRRETCSHGCSK